MKAYGVPRTLKREDPGFQRDKRTTRRYFKRIARAAARREIAERD